MRANYEPKKLWTNLCQPQLHQLTQASAKGSLGLYVIKIIIVTSVCDNNHSLTIVIQVVVMVQRDNRTL